MRHKLAIYYVNMQYTISLNFPNIVCNFEFQRFQDPVYKLFQMLQYI